jgi:hypothetical protein
MLSRKWGLFAACPTVDQTIARFDNDIGLRPCGFHFRNSVLRAQVWSLAWTLERQCPGLPRTRCNLKTESTSYLENRGYLPHAPLSTKPLHVWISISVFEHVASISGSRYSGHEVGVCHRVWNAVIHLLASNCL